MVTMKKPSVKKAVTKKVAKKSGHSLSVKRKPQRIQTAEGWKRDRLKSKKES